VQPAAVSPGQTVGKKTASRLVAALNDSVISFAYKSAEVPASTREFLRKAANDLKQLPTGNVVEIAGYTDNSGDEALNVALSQRRADAVRNALIKFGAAPDMLVAKGYGSADPIVSNDTREGRNRNRRIEYHIVKTPT
jgi:outer membrane protein OmpA-like peptidoglycan-associated protein